MLYDTIFLSYCFTVVWITANNIMQKHAHTWQMPVSRLVPIMLNFFTYYSIPYCWRICTYYAPFGAHYYYYYYYALAIILSVLYTIQYILYLTTSKHMQYNNACKSVLLNNDIKYLLNLKAPDIILFKTQNFAITLSLYPVASHS